MRFLAVVRAAFSRLVRPEGLHVVHSDAALPQAACPRGGCGPAGWRLYRMPHAACHARPCPTCCFRFFSGFRLRLAGDGSALEVMHACAPLLTKVYGPYCTAYGHVGAWNPVLYNMHESQTYAAEP